MAQQPHLSKRQRSIVKGYYANMEAAIAQRITEAVSDLYLAIGDEPRTARLWNAVEQSLAKSDADPAKARRIVQQRDLESLARLAPTLRAAPKQAPER